jgi:hypothetical protein
VATGSVIGSGSSISAGTNKQYARAKNGEIIMSNSTKTIEPMPDVTDFDAEPLVRKIRNRI